MWNSAFIELEGYICPAYHQQRATLDSSQGPTGSHQCRLHVGGAEQAHLLAGLFLSLSTAAPTAPDPIAEHKSGPSCKGWNAVKGVSPPFSHSTQTITSDRPHVNRQLPGPPTSPSCTHTNPGQNSNKTSEANRQARARVWVCLFHRPAGHVFSVARCATFSLLPVLSTPCIFYSPVHLCRDCQSSPSLS